MSFGIFSYLATILIFCGAALLLYVSRRHRVAEKGYDLTRADWRAILVTILIMVVLTGPMEGTALAWQVWGYNPERTLHITLFGAEVETYLFIILVSLVVGIATLVYAHWQEKKQDR